MNNEALVEKFLCPGCTCGSDSKCGSYNPVAVDGNLMCGGHCPGTLVVPGGKIALGLPKGFNKVGQAEKSNIRLWSVGTKPDWDRLNVPVWAMEKDGFLFVRTYCPRINVGWVDVIEGGKKEDCPAGVIDVGSFKDEID